MRAAGRLTAAPPGALATALLGALATALLGALATVLLPSAAGASAVPASVRAAGGTACVGVIVDARLLGGEVRTGCADGDPDSGFEALTRAGFSYAFVPRQPGLVCQVDGLPDCARTGTTTYWSYWHRAKGSARWTYASTGAATFDPAPGSTEAWVWQDGGRREPPDIALATICPQATAAPTPSTRPSRVPSPAAARPNPARAAASPRAGSASPGTAAPAPAPERATTPPPAAGETTPVTPAPDPSVTAAAPHQQAGARAAGPGAQAWAGALGGAGLVAALGGAAVVRSRRRGPS